MDGTHDPINLELLDSWQRGFPLVERPFAVLADELGISEQDVINRLQAKISGGRVTRVGATCAPNTISASTLAAVAAPQDRIEEVAQIIGDESGVNHSYLRENDWNLWFVATGPNRTHVDAALARIQHRSGLRVLDLRLVQPFNLDLGFSLRGNRAAAPLATQPDVAVLKNGDREIMQILMRGLPLVARPYHAMAQELGVSQAQIIDRINALTKANIIARFGVIVRHRALGWRANAMVVWHISQSAITKAGPALAAQPGVTLCYERAPVSGVWPYRLYSMIHARSRVAALRNLEAATQIPELKGVPHLALFSTRCFKQTGALISDKRKTA